MYYHRDCKKTLDTAAKAFVHLLICTEGSLILQLKAVRIKHQQESVMVNEHGTVN